MSAPRVFGVVLAAGEGSRMGGPKTRLMLHDRPLVAHHADLLREAGCDEVTLVVRPEEPRPPTIEALVVSVRTDSQAASLAAGLRELDRSVAGLAAEDIVVVTPADMLPPQASTIGALVRAVRRKPYIDAATPTHRGWSGHPVVVRFEILASYLDEGEEPPPLRDVIRRSRRLRVDVEDDAVLSDLDTPVDLALAARHARHLWMSGSLERSGTILATGAHAPGQDSGARSGRSMPKARNFR